MIKYFKNKNYFFLDKYKYFVYGSRLIDVHIGKYVKHSSFKDSEFVNLSTYLTNRMKSPTLNKPDEFKLYFIGYVTLKTK